MFRSFFNILIFNPTDLNQNRFIFSVNIPVRAFFHHIGDHSQKTLCDFNVVITNQTVDFTNQYPSSNIRVLIFKFVKGFTTDKYERLD